MACIQGRNMQLVSEASSSAVHIYFIYIKYKNIVVFLAIKHLLLIL
jgi:hypothetical protein